MLAWENEVKQGVCVFCGENKYKLTFEIYIKDK